MPGQLNMIMIILTLCLRRSSPGRRDIFPGHISSKISRNVLSSQSAKKKLLDWAGPSVPICVKYRIVFANLPLNVKLNVYASVYSKLFSG